MSICAETSCYLLIGDSIKKYIQIVIETVLFSELFKLNEFPFKKLWLTIDLRAIQNFLNFLFHFEDNSLGQMGKENNFIAR